MSILSSLSPIKKRTVFKIAVDLIKADNRIHSKEINILDKLQDELCLTQEDIDLTHYITLSDAVSSINELSDEQVGHIIDLFNGIMRADSDISKQENILLTALTLSCGSDSKNWVKVISVPTTETQISDSQIIFLEKQWCCNAHQVFDDKYDNLLISKAFGDIGFHLFHLPSVLEELGLKNKSGQTHGKHFGLLQKSIGYLTPYGTRKNENDIERLLNGFDTSTFFKVVLSALHLSPETFPFNSFLLIKIRDNIVFDDRNCSREVTDFLCIDMSDEVKRRILSFVSNFSEQTFMLPYEGYYKMFYDYLSSESKITSSILIDRNLHFQMENLEHTRVQFQSSPQARTFYLLLMHYGHNGVKQACFNEAIDYLQRVCEGIDPGEKSEGSIRREDAVGKDGFIADGKFDIETFMIDGKFSIEAVKTRMKEINSDWSILIFNTISLYQGASTKDEQKASYLSYILSILKHRSSLKTYVNTGFSEAVGLANPDLYHIIFDKEFNIYRTNASADLFFIEENGTRIPFKASSLWKTLI